MSRCGNKAYGIPSVVFQLFSRPTFHFDIPPTVFYPVPKVDSALVSFDFTKQHDGIKFVDESCLRKVLLTTFNRRRKMIRQSLKDVAAADGVAIPEKWSTKRPDELHPAEFIDLTVAMYGTKLEVAAKRDREQQQQQQQQQQPSIKKIMTDVSSPSFISDKGEIEGGSGKFKYETIWRKNFYELLKEGRMSNESMIE
jgi:hypothetical protein